MRYYNLIFFILLFFLVGCSGITPNDLEGVWFTKNTLDFSERVEAFEFTKEGDFHRYLFDERHLVQQQEGKWTHEIRSLKEGLTGVVKIQFPKSVPPISESYFFYYNKEKSVLVFSTISVVDKQIESKFAKSSQTLAQLLKTEVGYEVSQ